MRRKPYSELLALANGPSAARPDVEKPPASDPQPPAARKTSELPSTPGPSPKTHIRYRAELKALEAMVDENRRSADAEGRKQCLFVDEKLTAAAGALDLDDGDAAWFHLFGAANLCRAFGIQPESAARALARLNSMFR